jgi:hypothetical protein
VSRALRSAPTRTEGARTITTPPTTTFGRTGVTVTKLGHGATELRSSRLDAGEVDVLLDTVPGSGINVVDTLPDYGASEEQHSQGPLPPEIYAEAKARYEV